MDKNTVWFIAASAAFLLVWYRFFPPQAPAPEASTAVVEKQKMAELPASKAPSEPSPQWLRKSDKILPAAQTERTLETPFAKVVMGSQGAGVRHWWVKNGRSPVDLVNLDPKSVAELKPENFPLGTFPGINFEQIKSGELNKAEWKAVLPSGVELRKRLSLDPNTPFADIALAIYEQGVNGVGFLRLTERQKIGQQVFCFCGREIN